MTSLNVPDRRREDRVRQAVVELSLGDPAEVAADARLRPVGVVAGERPKSAPPSACVLSLAIWSLSGGWYMTWITCQPKADLTGASRSPGLRPGS